MPTPIRHGNIWVMERPVTRISREGKGSYVPTLGPKLSPDAEKEVAQLWRDLGNEEAVLACLPHFWHARAVLLMEEIRKAGGRGLDKSP